MASQQRKARKDDGDVCPDCGRPYVKITHHSKMTIVAHNIDRSGALPEVDDFCIISEEKA